VLIAVVLVAIVLIAALVRRPGLAKGLLAGAVVLMLYEAVIMVISVVAPNASAYGIGGGSGEDSISAQAKPGLWLLLAGLALMAAAFFVQRGGEGTPRFGPYVAPSAGYVPGTAPGYYPPPQQAGWQQPAPWPAQQAQLQPPSPRYPSAQPQQQPQQPPENPPSSSGPSA
jgi:hypothetical protein